MRMEQYLTFTDHALWEVIVNGDLISPVASACTGAKGPIPSKTAEQKLARKNELKAKSTLMLAIPDEHLLKLHACKDANTNETVNTAHIISAVSSKDQASTASCANDIMFSFFTNQSNAPQLDNEDLEQIDTDDLEEGNRNRDAPRCNAPEDTSATNALVVQDGIGLKRVRDIMQFPLLTLELHAPRADLSFAGLDDFVFKSKESDIEYRNVFKPKEVNKTVKPSLEKIEFVNATSITVENENKAENPRKFSQSPRGVARRWVENPHVLFTLRRILFLNSLMNSSPSRTTNLRNEISNFQQRFDESFHEVWDRYKDLLRACPHHGFTELHQLDTFYNVLNPADQDSLNAAVEIAKLTHAVNQQTSAVTTAMTAILKQFQATLSPASVKAVEEICVTFGGSGSLPRNTIANPKGEIKAITTRSDLVLDGHTVPTSPPFINLEEDERVEETLTDPDLFEYTIKLHVNITLADALILMPKYQKMLKALLSNKEKLQELANTPLNENCSAVILKKLPKNLRDPKKFLIPCGLSELKCKALADLGASVNLMPLSVYKKLGLPELISTRMTLELANQAICTPAEIARDVFVLVGKFTFPADFVIVDYESDPRVPLILGRPFLRTARYLIDLYGKEMILHDGEERLTLNMRHDTSSYSNQPQKESINLINVFNSSKVQDDIFDPEGGNVLPEKLLDLDSTKDLHPPLHVNQLSGSTTYSSSPNLLLEELADELALITFPAKYDDDLQFNVESDLKEIEFLLHQDSMHEMFTAEHAFNYSSPSIFNEYDDDFLEVESDAENFMMILLTPRERKSNRLVLSPQPTTRTRYLIQENPFEIITRVVQDKKLATCNASLVLEDFDPPFYEPLFFKEVPRSKMLLIFSSENEKKVFKPGIHISEKVYSSLLLPTSELPQLDKTHRSSSVSLQSMVFHLPPHDLKWRPENFTNAAIGPPSGTSALVASILTLSRSALIAALIPSRTSLSTASWVKDIYAAGSESRPPMLNKENYVPWSSRLLRYAKSRPNGKLIHNSILNGPFVRRMIPEPGDAERDVNTKDLHTADYTQLYDFLKYNQKEVDELKAERLAKIKDPLALRANSNNPYASPAPHQDLSPINQNYMQQPMPNPEDIIDPTTAMNMALALMAKAFKLNYSTPTNNNQRISSNPRNRQIAQPVQNVRNQVAQKPRVQNDGIQNQIGNGNLVA
nr:reverse transcriptase domain-containing protein [Tanacetum cinerariifolium]